MTRAEPAPFRTVPPVSRLLTPGLFAVLALAIVAAIVMLTSTTGDYVANGPVAGDNAGPAVNAVLHGELDSLSGHQPAMGLASILVRAPFAGLVSLLGGNDLLAYRMGALACMLPLAALAIWLAAHRPRAAVGRLPGLLAAGILLVSPAAIDAVRSGHPEEVLAAALATGAVIAATRRRSGWAGVMLGLAVGTKPWSLIALVPVLLALPGRRGQTAAIAGGLAGVLIASAPLADPAAFLRATHWVGSRLVNRFSLWWPLGSPVDLVSGTLSPTRSLPLGLDRVSASLVGLGGAALACGLVWARGRRRVKACDVLALLALLGVVRCASDPTTLEYYYLAALVPLAAWEAVGRDRAPVITAFATVAVALFPGNGLHGSAAPLNAAWIALTLVLGGYLTLAALGGEATDRQSVHASSALRPTTGLTEV